MIEEPYAGSPEDAESARLLFPVKLTDSVERAGVTYYDWTEQQPDPATGDYEDAPAPRSGTKEDGPFLVEINNRAIDVSTPRYAWARLRSVAGGQPLYEVEAGEEAGAGSGEPVYGYRLVCVNNVLQEQRREQVVEGGRLAWRGGWEFTGVDRGCCDCGGGSGEVHGTVPLACCAEEVASSQPFSVTRYGACAGSVLYGTAVFSPIRDGFVVSASDGDFSLDGAVGCYAGVPAWAFNGTMACSGLGVEGYVRGLTTNQDTTSIQCDGLCVRITLYHVGDFDDRVELALGCNIGAPPGTGCCDGAIPHALTATFSDSLAGYGSVPLTYDASFFGHQFWYYNYPGGCLAGKTLLLDCDIAAGTLTVVIDLDTVPVTPICSPFAAAATDGSAEIVASCGGAGTVTINPT